MPKNKKKHSTKSGRTNPGGDSSDEEGSEYNDNGSIFSDHSEASTVKDGSGEEGGVDESSQIEIWEGKVKESIEVASQKSAAGRVKGLDALCKCLCGRYASDFLSNQQITLCDVIERSIKKGKGVEVTTAARLGVLLTLQLSDCEEVYRELKPLLTQVTNDKTMAPISRAAVATCLAGVCFLGGGEMTEVVATMALLESIFSASYVKSETSVPNHSPEVQALHCAALDSWALLLTLLESGEVTRMATSMVAKIRTLLHSSDVDLRIASGEALALILEFAYDNDETYEPEDVVGLVASVKQLATDSTKSRSKKDRKEQRSSFRDILRGVEEGDPPSENIKFGKEQVHLDSWFSKIQYDWFCKQLGSGMNLHLASNTLLRDIFELGAPLPAFDDKGSNRPSKEERNHVNQMARKMRNGIRGKNRDKRSAVV